jgi:acetyl-CoA carboxylase carboxyl transferase subunit beta
MISKSGGARMMEAAYSLMQLKNICKLAQLAEEKYLTFHYVQTLLLRNDCILCYVRDINISEPGALIDSCRT